MLPSQTHFDYIIVGGGTAGCVVASRLHGAFPELSIALVEAGPDENDNPLVQDPRAAQALHETELQWKYQTAPQPHLNGRTLPHFGGKLLSGSSAVNYTAWTRGHAADYDRWADEVGDSRWSFDSLSAGFKRSEHWHDLGASEAHGFEGPIRTHSGDFGYPLRAPVREAFHSVGLQYNPDMNSGNPIGVSPVVLSWHNLKRQYAAACYPLSGVYIMCNTLVCRLLFDGSGRVSGVELEEGEKELHARKEVILSCGAVRTPQLLLLSGIGPKDELDALDIKVQVDHPNVGKNFIDHHAVTMFWKLKHPDRGYALGAPSFNSPSFTASLPMDWMITGKAPDDDLAAAAAIDGTSFNTGPRSDFEICPMYLTNSIVPKPWLPFDGSYISCGIAGLSTTSRGQIKLASANPRDDPVLDPNALSTEHDRAVLRAGMRTAMDAMSSSALEPYLEPEEIAPPGETTLNKTSCEEELNERIRSLACSWFHPMGTVAMGAVVDSECRVKGVDGLRVVDASIVPISLTAHLQAPVYALAEQAASLIIESVR